MKPFSFWLFITLLFVAACSSAGNQIATQASTPLAAEIFTPTPTILLPSITPTLTQTPTQPPPTETPFPTLTSDEVKTKLFNLLLDNGGCNLPCLLGYSPSVSTRNDIQNFFRQFRVKDTPDLSISRPGAPDRSFIEFYIRLKDNYLNMGISSYEDMGKVEVLGMGGFSQPRWDSRYAEIMKYYMLPQILTNYGEPTEIMILTFRNDRQRPDVTSFPFFIILLYPDQGFYVKYEMERISTGVEFLGCPSKSFVDIAVWSPGNNEVFERIAKPTINGEYFSDYKSLGDATSITMDEFYQTFSDPDSENCIETPIEMWPNP